MNEENIRWTEGGTHPARLKVEGKWDFSTEGEHPELDRKHRNSLEVSLDELLGQIASQHDAQHAMVGKKNTDYSGVGAFENFTQTAASAGVSVDTVFLFHIVNKVNRAKTLISKKGKANNEPLEDTLMDMANYANLWLAYKNLVKE